MSLEYAGKTYTVEEINYVVQSPLQNPGEISEVLVFSRGKDPIHYLLAGPERKPIARVYRAQKNFMTSSVNRKIFR